MRRRSLLTILIFAALIVILFACIRLNPVWRTKTYFALERGWNAHWPLSRGK